jgi:hypothetical protein
MKKIIFLTIGLITFIISDTNAQSDLLNAKKYWWYRWRLTNDFMVVGDCQGCSLPASERYGVPWEHELRWADGMIMMGQYLGMLATEYHLLASSGQSTVQTKKELYYALLAINRADLAAEDYIHQQEPSPTTCTPSLNGFFLRDDVPSTFVQDNFDHFNQYKTSHPHIDYTDEYDYDGDHTEIAYISHTHSDYSNSLASGNNNFFAEMSLDQAVSLFVGLRLIREFVDGSATYTDPSTSSVLSFQDGETSLFTEAKNISERIGLWLMDHGFLVKRPCTNDNVHIGCCGGVFWNWAIANVAGEDSQNPLLQAYGFPANVAPYEVWVQDACDVHAWDPGVNADPGSFYVGKFMVLELMAAGAEIYPFTSGNQYDCFNARTYLALNCDDPMPYKTEWMVLLNSIIKGYTPNSDLWPQRFQDYINSAPCTGPFIGTVSDYSYPNNPEWNWSTTSLLYRPEHRQYYWEANPSTEYAEFNGIDYMLLYNLYRIGAGMNSYPVAASYYNMTDVVWDLDFPVTLSSTFGSHANPIQQDGFNTFTATNTILPDGDVTYRAGYEINLTNDFSVQLGADFHAYLDPFDCDRTVDNEYRNEEFHSMLAGTQNIVAHRPLNAENNDHLNAFDQSTDLASSIYISPNPNQGDFLISIKSAVTSNPTLYLIDLSGRILHTQSLSLQEGVTQIQLSKPELPAGIYFIKVDGFDEQLKIIITQ